MTSWLDRARQHWVTLLILIFYCVTHFWNLTILPVFADEAIYIRWAQLILDDAPRYLFFALNDGKTPLFIWLSVPFQFLIADKLLATRVLSVLIGLIQVLVIQQVIYSLGGRNKAAWLGMVLTCILPFWFFYHRFAVMDGLLTLCISLSVWGAIKVVQHSEMKLEGARRQTILWMVWTGLWFGAALWSKLPALFALPSLLIWIFLPKKPTLNQLAKNLSWLSISAVIGVACFAALKISPAFGQLFRRGQDFAYPVSEVLFGGRLKQTLPNIPTYITYFITYLTLPALLLSFAGWFSQRMRRPIMLLCLCALAFCLPFTFFGKVVYARYFLPISFFITVASALSLQALFDRWFADLHKKLKLSHVIAALVMATLVSMTFAVSAQFMSAALFSPNTLPLVSSDRQQYLEEWSSGHGITEVVSYIHSTAKDHSIAIATEGSFGTLPDGILLYLHGSNVNNIYVEGIGQPVRSLPDFFIDRAKTFDQTILVVNSHRMFLPIPKEKLLQEYCRPNNAPCLQVWDITDLVQTESARAM